MKILKSLNFIKKHKTIIILPIICLFQFLACFYYDLWIVATIFSIILILISDFAQIIYYTLFFQMFSNCGNFSVISTFVASGVICLKYIIGLIKKSENFYPIPFILTCLICVFGSIHFTSIDIHGIYQGSSLIVALFFIYLIFVNRDRFKIQKCADFLISGILATAFISLLTLLFKSHLSNLFSIFGDFHGLKLLTGNENSLSIYCSLALSVYVTNIINGKGNLVKNILFGITAIAFGLTTMSKCFLIVCVFIMLYLFFMLIMKYKLKSITFIGPAILILAVISLAFNSTIGSTIDRFVMEIDGKLSLSVITTGRSELWTIYINKITSSIPNMLVGVGLFSERLIRKGPHNLLILLLYRLGFIGLIMIVVLGYFYYRDSNKTLKPTLKNSLTLMVFIMISMIESFL